MSSGQFLFATHSKVFLTYTIAANSESPLNNMVGKSMPLSTIKNPQFITLGAITDYNRKMVISPKHYQDMIGRDSPGVGAYAYDFVHLSQSVLGNKRKIAEVKIGTEHKFHELSSVTKLKEK